MENRSTSVAFALSLTLHLGILIFPLLPFGWVRPNINRPPIEVIYEYELAKEELRQVKERLRQARETSTSAPAPGDAANRSNIRIPDRSLINIVQDLPELLSRRSAVIDLTDLVDASRGDPVLLSYFSAIREQIQHAANRRTWLTGELAEGLIYISFILGSSGRIEAAEVVGERSVSSGRLRDIAVKIVKAASPFPPFPPSLHEETKTIVVPLEFLLGS